VFRNLQLSLYDFFGYLLPGAVLSLSAWVAFGTLFWPQEPVLVWAPLSTQGAVVLLLIAYLVGHLGQGIGNLLQKLPLVDPLCASALAPTLEDSVRRAASSRFGIAARDLTASQLLELCGEALLHSESPGEQEIFTYREGFYRGIFVSLIFLAFALIVRLIRGPAAVFAGGTAFELARGPLSFGVVLSLVGAWLALQRYKRFAAYRMRRTLLRFLALETARAAPKEERR